MGGAITGEHGVGMEKDRLMPLMFSEADLELMRACAPRSIPTGLLNPGKIFPLGQRMRRNSHSRRRSAR